MKNDLIIRCFWFVLIDSTKGSSTENCPALQTERNVSTIRQNIIQALSEYPNITGAQAPTSITRLSNLTWPRGSYSLLMAHEGCPAGPWANGTRHHDTVDRYPNNLWFVLRYPSENRVNFIFTKFN